MNPAAASEHRPPQFLLGESVLFFRNEAANNVSASVGVSGGRGSFPHNLPPIQQHHQHQQPPPHPDHATQENVIFAGFLVFMIEICEIPAIYKEDEKVLSVSVSVSENVSFPGFTRFLSFVL